MIFSRKYLTTVMADNKEVSDMRGVLTGNTEVNIINEVVKIIIFDKNSSLKVNWGRVH